MLLYCIFARRNDREIKIMKKMTKQLFRYPQGFSGIELLQSKNEDETELPHGLVIRLGRVVSTIRISPT